MIETDEDSSRYGFPKGHLVGWDYTHCDDCAVWSGYGTRHTIKDLLYDVKHAILSLIEISI